MVRTKTWAGSKPAKLFQNAPTGLHVATIIRRNGDVNGRGGLENNVVPNPKIGRFSNNTVDSQFGLA